MTAPAGGRPFLRWFVVIVGAVAIVIGVFNLSHLPETRRIARALAQHGTEVEARILSARVTTSRLPSQVAARSAESVFYSATIGLGTGSGEVETEIYLTPDEYTAFQNGSLDRVTVISLPDDPAQVERNRGDRLAAGPTDLLLSLVLILMGAVPAIGAGLGPVLLRRFGGAR